MTLGNIITEQTPYLMEESLNGVRDDAKEQYQLTSIVCSEGVLNEVR